MNKIEAIQNGLVRYSTGKPCRRGHHAERYTSSGSCVECTEMFRDATANAAKIARGKRNLAMADGCRDHTYLHSPAHHTMMLHLCEILRYSPKTVIANLHEHIDALYDVCPSPRILNRDDLLSFMDYRPDGTVANYRSLRFTSPESRGDDDPLVYLYHNGIRYVASEAMEVLRGQRLNVRPK